MPRRLTTDEFIEKAKAVHGDKYDYSKTEYAHSQKKLIIICRIHGEFEQTPRCHLQKHNCPKCANVSRIRNEKANKDNNFNAKAALRSMEDKWGNVYTKPTKKCRDYSKWHPEDWEGE